MRQISELELQLQAKQAEVRHAQALVDAAQQNADAHHAQEVHTVAILPSLPVSQHQIAAANAVEQLKQLHALQAV